MSEQNQTDSIRGMQSLFIPVFVKILTKTPLRTAIFTIVTVGGGVGYPVSHGNPLVMTVIGAWVATFGAVIVTEAIHGCPTAEVDDGY